MDTLHVIVLAIVQGLTEFLPISSSAHLILVPVLLGWQDQGLAFDVAVHFGTLTAVVAYFRRELHGMAVSWFDSLRTRNPDEEARLAWAVLISMIPLGIGGLLFHEAISTHLRSPLVIASTTIIFGLALWYADVKGVQTRCEYRMGAWRVAAIAFAQVLALIPGTSRSGITITAGLMVGLDRKSAARFSFLLSVPAIAMAALYETRNLIEVAEAVDWVAMALGVVLSALSAYLCIHYFLKLLDRVGMLPFVVYRLVLGIGLFAIFW
ncbi:Undecaprenyl-diphosphatase [hydrothermal vent metagenome]|uniref:Undecaprenyl-diphosphatase n=1 Tax=hydrothermal vent metagenome TaxID=652676 RepID=A0A3B0YSR2_9ZZZZ